MNGGEAGPGEVETPLTGWASERTGAAANGARGRGGVPAKQKSPVPKAGLSCAVPANPV